MGQQRPSGEGMTTGATSGCCREKEKGDQAFFFLRLSSLRIRLVGLKVSTMLVGMIIVYTPYIKWRTPYICLCRLSGREISIQ